MVDFDMVASLVIFYFLFVTYSFLIISTKTSKWQKVMFGVIFSSALISTLSSFFVGWMANLIGA